MLKVNLVYNIYTARLLVNCHPCKLLHTNNTDNVASNVTSSLKEYRFSGLENIKVSVRGHFLACDVLKAILEIRWYKKD